ncbi:TniQ family protein [Photobacterium swingsii]|uniref:TniQ family protein n=1 Tax=Photobacterium swingsii TaxID=680026 RepID=UPI0040692195
MFLQRPTPYDDESLESFFIRTANANGYSDVHRFLVALKRYLKDINCSKYQTFPTDIRRINPYSSKINSGSRTEALHKLSQMTFNEPGLLLGLAINRSSMKFSASTSGLLRGSELIPRSLLRSDVVPCCPLCLTEDGYASYRWHFEGYDYCHKHGTQLITQCQCGSEYDYRDAGVNGYCKKCAEQIKTEYHLPPPDDMKVSQWLAGENIEPLPSLPIGYRWGLIHWWKQISPELTGDACFVQFWLKWPSSFYSVLEPIIDFKFNHAAVALEELRIKDVLDDILFKSILLPDRSLRYNLILREIFHYLEDNVWRNDCRLANLKMNALEVALLLNTSLDQVSSVVEQRLLRPNRRLKPDRPFNHTDDLFYLGDVYCLWLAEFQTADFNRSFYTSRW